jgi:hypothetical protein
MDRGNLFTISISTWKTGRFRQRNGIRYYGTIIQGGKSTTKITIIITIWTAPDIFKSVWWLIDLGLVLNNHLDSISLLAYILPI